MEYLEMMNDNLYLDQYGHDLEENLDLPLEIDDHNPLQPSISIDHVQNLCINGEPDAITRSTFPRVDDFRFVSWKSKSKKRSFKKKLKKIVREANELYQKMRLKEGFEGESLDDHIFEDQM